MLPHLKPQVSQLWEKCFKAAYQLAKDETSIKPLLNQLTPEEVFQAKYSLDIE